MKTWKSRVATGILSVAIAAPFAGAASVDAATVSSHLSRGDFFDLAVQELKITSDHQVSLPSDVTEASPHAGSLRVLMDHQLVMGYPDGLARVEEPISGKEAEILMGRLLAYAEGKSGSVDARKELNINWIGEPRLDEEDVKGIFALINAKMGSSASDKIAEMSTAQAAVYSFKADSEASITIDTYGVNQSSVKASSASQTYYDQKNGIKTVSTLKTSSSDQALETTSFVVPGGIFSQIPDGNNGNLKWVKLNDTGFSFDQLVDLQKNSTTQLLDLNKKYFSYKDLGTETVNGTAYDKVEYTGSIPSATDLLSDFEGVLGGTSMSGSEDAKALLKDTAIDATGTLWINPQTHMLYRNDVTISLTPKTTTDTAATNLSIKMSTTYSGYNEAQSITLPKEAESAETLNSSDVNKTIGTDK